MSKVKRRDFLMGLVSIPFLGYFAFGSRKSIISNKLKKRPKNNLETLKINSIDVLNKKLIPPTGIKNNTLRIGIIGNGWRGEELLQTLGFVHPEIIEKNTTNGKYNNYFKLTYVDNEDLNVEITAICDVFDVHTQRGVTAVQKNILCKDENKKFKPPKIYKSYRDMLAGNDIDAIIIATADHTHAKIAIEAANAGKHVYLEKPMAHSIEDAIKLRDTIKSTGVVFQLGHQNRQQMSYKIANELYKKGVLGDVSVVQTYTNRNSIHGAWIRDDSFDHHLGNKDNIDWKEFLNDAPWHEFDLKRFFSWQRYNDYGTSITGNNFTHQFDCINQILDLGIPKTVMATGGQYYYKSHGDMPDVYNAVFNYPERKLSISYNGTLKNDVYQPTRILGSEATMDVDRAIFISENQNNKRYKDVVKEKSEPIFYYDPQSGVDAVTSATSQVYIKSGYGPTYLDGKMRNATFVHLKEWIDSIRGQGEVSCNIDKGFEEAVTFNLANLSFRNKKAVTWDEINEKAIIG